MKIEIEIHEEHIKAFVTEALAESIRSHSGIASQRDLEKLGAILMSAISDFATAQNGFNDQIDAAVAGLTSDVASLNDQIAKLQATQGAITPEDQALLDGIQSRSQSIASKLTALDALTPPIPPAA